MGLFASLGPVLVLLLIVLQVEETESIEAGGADKVDIVSETGVSSLIPIAALALSLVAVVLVWFWAKRAVDPIDRMTEMADEVQAGSLDRRLALDSAPVEIRRLGESFDRMLDRLASASTLERQLIEDASHELRTPLAALSARLEVADRRSAAGDVSEDLARCADEIDRMQSTLDALLASARIRQNELQQLDNDVTQIVSRVVEHRRILSPDVDLSLDAPEQVRIGIDGAALERAVTNLVTNAVEHGGGEPVTVRVREAAESVVIDVSDSGPGIPPHQLPTIFDRYAGDHHGIGLAIVKQVADAYGTIEVVSPPDEQATGTRFTLRLRRAGASLPKDG